MKRTTLIIWCAIAAIMTSGMAHAAVTIYIIEPFTSGSSCANGVSPSGYYVVGDATSSGWDTTVSQWTTYGRAYVYTVGASKTGLPDEAGGYTSNSANAIAGDKIVGFADGYKPAVWTGPSWTVDILSAPEEEQDYGQANAVSLRGVYAGETASSATGMTEATLWTMVAVTTLETYDGNETDCAALGMAYYDGSDLLVIGYNTEVGQMSAEAPCWWDDTGSAHKLEDWEDDSLRCGGGRDLALVNAPVGTEPNYLIVGCGSDDTYSPKACCWLGNATEDFDKAALPLPQNGGVGEAYAVSDGVIPHIKHGRRIVGRVNISSADKAVLWNGQWDSWVASDLNTLWSDDIPEDVVLIEATGISANGRVICGNGTDDGSARGWVAVLGYEATSDGDWTGGSAGDVDWDPDGTPDSCSDTAVIDVTGVTISSGEDVTVGELYIGEQPSSTGSLTQSGGDMTVCYLLCLGYFGDGTYTQTGGTLDIWDALVISSRDDSSGELNISGGITTAANVIVGFDETDFALDGTLDLDSGADISVSNSVILGGGATLEVESGGELLMALSDGNDEAYFSITDTNATDLSGLGNLTLLCEFDSGDVGEDNVVTIEAAGEDAPSSSSDFDTDNFVIDELVVGCPDGDVGDTACGITVKLVDDHNNGNRGGGDEAVLLNSLSILAGGMIDNTDCDLYYLDGGNVRKFKPGDADLDGDVDLDDFTVQKNNWGMDGATWSQGDFDADRDVDLSDFVILKNNMGT